MLHNEAGKQGIAQYECDGDGIDIVSEASVLVETKLIVLSQKFQRSFLDTLGGLLSPDGRI